MSFGAKRKLQILFLLISGKANEDAHLPPSKVLEELRAVPALSVLCVHALEVEQAGVLYHSPEHPEHYGEHGDEHQHQAPGVSHGQHTQMGHSWTSAETITKHLITQTSFPKNKRHTSYVTIAGCIDMSSALCQTIGNKSFIIIGI